MGTHALEGHLTALQRKGVIVLGTRTHRSIRLVDPDEAAVIDPTGSGCPGHALTSETFTVDRLPGTLVRRLEARADFFVQVSDRRFEAAGIAPGDLVAVREKSEIGTGSVVLARHADGTALCFEVNFTDDLEIVLRPIVETHRSTGARRVAANRKATVLIEGALAGIVRARPIQHCKGFKSVPKRDGNAATTNKKSSPRQAAVLGVLRSHIRRTGVPASLHEVGRELGQTAGSVHKHVRELVKKGLVQKVPVGQRAYWPTDMVTVPIVEPEAGKALAKSTITDRAPSVLAGKFDPRPDFVVPSTPEIAIHLGLEPTDLIAVRAITEGTTGEIVIARAGERGRWFFGEFRRDHDGIAEVRPIAGGDAAPSAVTGTAGDAVHVEGIVIGVVTFRSL